VSDSNGLVLGSAVRLAFFPNPSFHGTPPPLLVRLIDTSTDIPVVGDPVTGAELAGTTTVVPGIDVSGANHGGSTAVSDGIVPLNVRVTTNFNPVFPPKPVNPFDPWLNDGVGLAPGWLVGTIVYRSLTTERPGVINVSTDAFYGSDSARFLTYEASKANGGPLPPWLSFNPATLTFSGVPPESAAGTLDLRVLARDQNGHQAVAEVHLFITRDAADLMKLLRAARAVRHIDPRQLAPPGHPPPPAAEPAGRPDAPPSNPVGGTWLERPGTEVGRGTFSSQLRDQTFAGRLARTRAMLSALSGIAA
jgi:hypothetical protein